MTEIKIYSILNFTDFVKECIAGTKYLLPDNCRYKWVKFEKCEDYYTKETYYSWAMEYNYKVSGSVGYIFPIGNSNKVKQFKTEKGAKDNFIKKYSAKHN